MKHGITLEQVWEAMRAAGPPPMTIEAMRAALSAVYRRPGGEIVTSTMVDIALSAYGLLGRAGSAESDMQRALEAVAQFIAPKPKRTEVTISEVRQALRDWLPESGGFIKTGDVKMLRLLRERLRLDFTEAAGYYARHRFEGQVNRALNGLARDGELCKVGAGTRGPNGQMTGQREAWFYTPDAWDEAEAGAAKRRKDAGLAAQRASAVCDRLAALGVIFQTWHDGLPKPDLEGWEALLELVHASRRLPTHVTFAHPDAGYEAARANANAVLEPGKVYILKTLRVERSYSTVELATPELQPVPGEFGTEFFEIYEPGTSA